MRRARHAVVGLKRLADNLPNEHGGISISVLGITLSVEIFDPRG